MKSRIALLSIFFLLLTAAVIVRLFTLQVLSYSYYKDLAENQHKLYKVLVPLRGEIFAQEGKNGKLFPLVQNVEKNLVYAVPPEISDKEKTASSLEKVLEMPKKEILEKISDNERKWVALKKELPESVSVAITNLKLNGIYLQPETLRLYPEQNFASQILGFVGYQGDQKVGQYGIEEYFEKILAGSFGSLTLDKDVRGRWIVGGTRELQPAIDGADIILTLDKAIQFRAETILKATVEKHQADGGSMIVLDPKTGRILAMANFPNFDPNNFKEVENQAVFRNSAISDAYEPGSVFKPITMAAGLDAEVITPDMTYEDTGSVVLDEYVIKNANGKVYGVRTMKEVLEQSINTGAIFVVNKVGAEKFLDTVKKFSFGSQTGITLPAEAPASIKNLIGGGQVHYATASFGQGISVTTLQLAQACAAIANQGKLMKPYIVDSIGYPDGEVETFEPQEVGQVILPRTANTVAAMMVSVVENGHGKKAKVAGYYVAGKTGTAQVAKADSPGYDPNLTIGTFAGFAPVGDPAFVIVVKIANPRTVQFAESTAAPAFGEMARFLLNYYQIPPTR